MSGRLLNFSPAKRRRSFFSLTLDGTKDDAKAKALA